MRVKKTWRGPMVVQLKSGCEYIGSPYSNERLVLVKIDRKDDELDLGICAYRNPVNGEFCMVTLPLIALVRVKKV